MPYRGEYIERPAPNVIFRGFWKDQDVTKKFLLNLVSRIDIQGKTFVLTSVFPRRTLPNRISTSIRARATGKLSIEERQRISYGLLEPIINKQIVNIWFSGENARIPSSDGWDAYLSSETDETIENSVFLPFWATRFGETVEKSETSQQAYLKTRSLEIADRDRVCAVIGNPEPTRLNFIKHLQKYIPVDVLGSIVGRYVPNKQKLLAQYKMNICFENDLFPNYVTEKAFESWNSGCVPIWWGMDSEGYINPSALINLAEKSFKSAIENIVEIYENDEISTQIVNSPLLLKAYSYQKLLDRLQKIILS